ncbi:hypothetical protein ZYGR_0A00710 [Zygosaccharomyces rouxii]|uniref:peptide chain release factor N(5)-glutamine methyltransferase n=2 Tax=Zygosaccharomyces rouxii TaxID=4956 RepID=C5DP96_ZYGRC|nr:uncharacterized protein ZYRO0A01518g [Zygosaccharomyces rouxii]KAH9198973.1 S-adenosyl-L-methionine-dependent methyltransferase [Zygosaccharomyces rouxii]GAV46479.1 hypothetical protein ZYGR_0A00710 [Zygosaccharomyces rouxii]CAR25507.1 ZYRO0A01518p [Zygosaccharomyces rouxii]
MPRVAPRLLKKALKAHSLLPLLLPACRSIEQSAQEFRWIRNELPNMKQVRQACLQRFKLVPLQYILGNQPFGELDIVCRPGVLIPRWETEEWVCELSERLLGSMGPLNSPFPIWDLCCGTGCVGLLLQRRLGPGCSLTAVDVTDAALGLCVENAHRNDLERPRLIATDVLTKKIVPDSRISLLTCNPPYIPKNQFAADTSPSVKRHEPQLALIGDLEFYSSLVNTWIHHTDSFVYEVGDRRQIEYVMHGIRDDPRLQLEWCVGYRLDSSGCPRVVYGYKAESSLAGALSGYGDLLYIPPGAGK